MSIPTSRDDVLVQPILINYTPEARAIDVIEQVALASASMIQRTVTHEIRDDEHQPTDHRPTLDWLSGAMTKSVRRISRTKITKLHEEAGSRSSEWTFGVGAVPAFDPEAHGPVVVAAAGQVTTYAELPSIAKKGQVSFSGPAPMVGECSEAPGERRYVVHLDGELGMSVGKMSAQAAHALTHLAMSSSFDKNTVDFVIDETSTIEKLVDEALVVVRDNGLTEIPAGSLTAIVTHV